VPPVHCTKSEEIEWTERINLLQNYLATFSSIGSRPFSEYETQDAIDEKWQELVSVLDWIERKIQKE
jgi:hypothetical protein